MTWHSAIRSRTMGVWGANRVRDKRNLYSHFSKWLQLSHEIGNYNLHNSDTKICHKCCRPRVNMKSSQEPGGVAPNPHTSLPRRPGIHISGGKLSNLELTSMYEMSIMGLFILLTPIDLRLPLPPSLAEISRQICYKSIITLVNTNNMPQNTLKLIKSSRMKFIGSEWLELVVWIIIWVCFGNPGSTPDIIFIILLHNFNILPPIDSTNLHRFWFWNKETIYWKVVFL